MIVLTQKSQTFNPQLISLFGLGLIGSSILSNLNRSENYTQSFLPFEWNNPAQQKRDADSIVNYISKYLHELGSGAETNRRVTFIWSAGKGGFSVSAEVLRQELNSYDVMLSTVKCIMERFPDLNPRFYLLSSAGGLFEGQKFVDTASEVTPQRPYGQLKHQQEKRLAMLDSHVIKKIYRPTSVYGIVNTKHRMGLIPTLIYNTFHNKVSTIYGNLSTLRDYVSSSDIGAFIADAINTSHSTQIGGPVILGSGKPSSIYEIKKIVEKLMGKKVYIEFRDVHKNTCDITFSPALLPEKWHVTDMETSIRLIYQQFRLGLAS